MKEYKKELKKRMIKLQKEILTKKNELRQGIGY